MREIKSIETNYNGYFFRSRLEARWAVFFDALGIPYEYEKEGYPLGDGMFYLPDFWLPEQRLFLEIKGGCPCEDDLKKIKLLSQKFVVVLAMGDPYKCYMTAFSNDISDGSAGASESYDVPWFKCRKCNAYNIAVDPNGRRTVYNDLDLTSPWEPNCLCGAEYRDEFHPSIANAGIVARSARFE